jgi:pilus assembly protein Flp/PilA
MYSILFYCAFLTTLTLLFLCKVFLLGKILSIVFAAIKNTLGGNKMKKFLQWLKNEESGQGMVEYGLIIAVVAIVAVVGLGLLGGHLNTFFEGLKTKIVG